MEVEPRRYRFRVLNGANGRFFHLTLSDTAVPSRPPTNATFHQIGVDQGLLAAPVPLERLSIAPGERADLIVDFSSRAGESVILKNDNNNIMQFRVAKNGSRDANPLPQTLRPVPKISESSAIKTRSLTLMEIDDPVQRPVKMLLNNAHWNMPVTENPVLDSTEIWSLVNLTDDAHPIHLHLVRFQILDRRAFNIGVYWATGEIKYNGAAMPPEPGEAGWKDTVRADPGMITRIIIRFEGFTGRYVWHLPTSLSTRTTR